jgi:hypothetical protein
VLKAVCRRQRDGINSRRNNHKAQEKVIQSRAVRLNPAVFALFALAALSWAILGLIFAAVGPSALVPRIFYSYHVEHFLALYVIAFLGATAFPSLRLKWIWLGLFAMSLILAVVRLRLPHHRLASTEDFLCDLAGASAALAPIVLGRFRDAYVARRGP